jgi:hypothetical protein
MTVPYVAKVVNNFPSHGNNLGMPVVSMTSRAKKGGGAETLSLRRGEIYRCVERSRGETRGEDPSPLQFLKYYASPRQNYSVGTFHISNQDIKIKN